jgi:hypothetical protein
MLQVFSSWCDKSRSGCCIHACYKRMFQCFRYFHTYVASISSRCCIAMLTSVLRVFQTYVASISAVFKYMLQVSHLGVAKVDLVLRMLQWDLLPQPPATATGWRLGGTGPLLGRYQAGANGHVKNRAQVWGPCVGARKKQMAQALLLRRNAVTTKSKR